MQYVGVANGHKEIMQLGGNLPDSLNKYLVLGHGEVTEEDKDLKVSST